MEEQGWVGGRQVWWHAVEATSHPFHTSTATCITCVICVPRLLHQFTLS